MTAEHESGAESMADHDDPLADSEERRVLHAAFDSFRQYRRAAHYNITHLRRQSFYALPAAQKELLSAAPFSLPKTFDAVDNAIDSNADIAEAILDAIMPGFGLSASDETWKGKATQNDMDKARSTIRQMYRDWSAEGLPERHASFAPIMAALNTYLPAESPAQRHQIRVLVPGAGLGRLVFDMCLAGYTVEGNEISYHQLLASQYLLNYTQRAGQHTLFPWALSFSNHNTRANQLRSVAIPDAHPGAALEAAEQEIGSEVHYSERMSMSTGDFCVVYRQPDYEDTFDAVATCFFIDTAPNVIHYIETIKTCLRPGGVWINLGPLLWHFESTLTPAEREKAQGKTKGTPSDFEGIGEPGSFELSNDEVTSLVSQYGFEIVEQRDAPATGYIQDPSSMLQNVYQPTFWVAKKK
ncbi:hypothetical protein M409DRAFT_69373 [Zasmidium cellare ATCC 36951]|uniref:carnosine N-methyltransferase n=1 Tax=Zasmidium cellare ATCC 36951 TaxID=1080233 RepID=A0A6A6C9N6_ZASCE|nr:uncharacterized protein M409DRAFT_69373 [Zasmidium cellare ATCC 36951]KAF2162166.1 hypothetical protein M409DRAFT_69373 [Zasmidium cellare ATCC 36951]